MFLWWRWRLGSPLERDPLKVLLDVQKGWVSVEGAKKDYGVIITKLINLIITLLNLI